MRLACAVVGVLAEDDGFDGGKFGGFEGVEYVGGGGVDCLAGGAFGADGVEDVSEVGLLFFGGEGLGPGVHGLSVRVV